MARPRTNALFINRFGSEYLTANYSASPKRFSLRGRAVIVRAVIKPVYSVLSLFVLALLSFFQAAAGEKSPAHEALGHFRRGANFGNYLEAPRGQDWGMRYNLQDLQNVKKEGFDHVRLPIAWHHYTSPGPAYTIEPQFFAKVDFLVTNTLQRGLSMIINIQHFDDFTSDPEAFTPKFRALWEEIAVHYASQPNQLAFELLNEPKDKATTEVMNPIYAQAIAVIRKTNPNRPIFLGPSRWNSLDEVEKLKLPEERNLIVTVHSYEPFTFTHQGTTWTGDSVATVGIKYPGPPNQPLQPDPAAVRSSSWISNWFKNYNTMEASRNPSGPVAFAARMEKVAAWGKANNRPIHLGEFGAFEKADRASRVHYYADMRRTAERLDFGWAVWDWKAGFRYWDGDKPVEGMREALFGAN